MLKPESVLENKTLHLLWDFRIQMDHLISARRPDPVLFKKKKDSTKQKQNLISTRICHKKKKLSNGFCRYGGLQRGKKETKRLIAREVKNL